ncbi:MAG: hypothetical protein ABW252_06800 [Polyangiales bacterium]
MATTARDPSRAHPYGGTARILTALLLATAACAADRDAARDDNDLSALEVPSPAERVCTPGDDATCNAGAREGWFTGTCQSDATCACALGTGDAGAAPTGRCAVPERSPAFNGTFGVAAAARTEEAAVVVTQTGSGSFTRTTLQWVDGLGVARGAPVRMPMRGGIASGATPAVATDGTHYLACWSETNRVHCASVAPGGTEATHVLELPGYAPAVAFGGAGWTLAYDTYDGSRTETWAQRLDARFQPTGPARRLAEAAGRSSSEPVLTARGNGFVAIAGRPATLHDLDAELAPRATPVELGVAFWTSGSLAATEHGIAVGLAIAYGAQLIHIDASGVKRTRHLGGGGKWGLPVDVRVAGDGFRAAWNDVRGWRDEAVDTATGSGETTGQFAQFVSFELGGTVLVAVTSGSGVHVLRRPPPDSQTAASR